MACVRVVAEKTAAELTADNPRLTRGQMFVETDTGLAKVNFHSQAPVTWNSLAYWNPFSVIGENIADPTGAATDTDDEARAAIASILDLLEAAGLMAAAE